MGRFKEPRQTWTTPLLDKKMIDASRTEILVVAFGILFLVSQLCLIIWIFARPHVFSHKKEHRKTTAISRPASNSESNGDANDDESPKPRRNLRRRSTWSSGSLEKQYLRQRRRSGGLGELGEFETPLSSSETDSNSDRSTRQGIRDMGIMAAAYAVPTPTRPLRPLRKPYSSTFAEAETEMKEFDPRKAWKEMGVIAAAIAKPRSPRSPRLNAAEQAAIMAALTADDGGIKAPSPTPAVVENAGVLASGFDDPLGVNRQSASPKQEMDAGLDRVRSV